MENFENKENEYFDEKTKDLIKQNFELFDRDKDGFINWEETKETIISLNYQLKEEKLLQELFDLFKKEEDLSNEKGITFRSFLILLSKEKKEKDLEAILQEAFKTLDPESIAYIESDKFRELLMYNGYKYNEEQIDVFMRFADPKGTGKINYFEFIKTISNVNPKKKRKKRKKKK